MRLRVDGVVGRNVQRVAKSKGFRKVAPPVMAPLDRYLHRVSGGRILLSRALVPSIVLTTTGAKTGKARQVPLACMPDGDVIYIVGSNFGREAHPAWSGNLLRTPEAKVSLDGDEFDVVAHPLTGEEKAEIWPRLLEAWPAYDHYTEVSQRDLRVFRLERA
jgi:deazaflavin-dependent oxidoreductase (nitroreductase family)